MSIKLELNGIVYQTGEPKTKNNYTKQEMILHIPDLQKEEYSDHLKIEWNTNGIKMIQDQKIQNGDQVKIVAYLSGIKWTDQEETERFFNSVKGYTIEKASEGMPAAHELTPFPMLDKEEEQTENDLPF